VAAAEGPDEVVHCRWGGDARAYREGGQLQAGHPPLGACLQGLDLRLVQVQVHHRAQEPGRLLGGEAQVGGPDLNQFAPAPHPGQRELGVGPGGHGHHHLRRQVLQQEGESLVHFRAGRAVEVVQGDHGRALDVQPVDHGGQHLLGGYRPAGGEEGQGLGDARAAPGGQRLDQVGDEPARVGVGLIQRHPGDPRRLSGVPPGPGELGEPLGEQGGLAEAGGRRDQHQSRQVVGPEQRVGEPGAVEQFPTRGWHADLGAQSHPHSVAAGVGAAGRHFGRGEIAAQGLGQAVAGTAGPEAPAIRGRRAVNTAPAPGPALAATRSPPCPRMISREMVSPIPVPESCPAPARPGTR